MFRIKRSKLYGQYTNERALESIINSAIDQSGRELCLDVGAGNVDDGRFTRLDISSDHNPDILVDIKDLFLGDLVQDGDVTPLPLESYMVIRLNHAAEHIEWIYQKQLFDWAYRLLLPGGIVTVATPNLEYIVGVYTVNKKRQLAGKKLKYPVVEHPYLNIDTPSDMQWWFNFKMFSGGSPGDNHFCSYDRRSLHDMLAYSRFTGIRMYDGATLKSVAYKKKDASQEITSKVIEGATS